MENRERSQSMLAPESVLRPPFEMETIRLDGATILLDPRGPNWVATDEKGETILLLFDGERNFNQVVQAYATDTIGEERRISGPNR
jgi:hypothetical protein